ADAENGKPGARQTSRVGGGRPAVNFKLGPRAVRRRRAQGSGCGAGETAAARRVAGEIRPAGPGAEMKTASVMASLSRKGGGMFESVRRLHQSLAEIPGVRVTIIGLEDE